MKKLFKQLSIVLVLAMVIGLVPARQASAADYSVKLKHKYLFVGGAKGVDANGNLPANPIKKSYKVKINGLEKGDVVTLKSSDKTVAKAANNKYPQRVFAVAPGAAEFTVKVNGAEVGTLKVTVKQNATALEIVDLPENNQFGIGTYEVKVAATPAAATDVVKVVIADEYKDIAVVNEDGTITTKKPGTFKMSAVACQNAETLPGATAKAEEVECTVAVKVVSAAQKSADEVKFEFDTDMTKIAKAADFKVYYEENGAKFDVAQKSATVVKADPKTVVLKVWTAFKAERVYTVEYSGQKVTFTGAKLTLDQAKSIRFNTTEVVFSKQADIDFTVLDANGVEFAAEDVATAVTFETTSTDCSIAGSKILFYEKDKKATVTAKFSAWYLDATTKQYTENKFSDSALFTSVDAAVPTVKDSDWSLGVEGLADFEKATYVQKTALPVNRTETLGFYVEYSDDSTIDFVTDAAKLTYTSADNNIVVMSGNTVKPVAVGTTQIVVRHADYKDPIYVIPVTVQPKAVPTTVEVVPSKNTLNSDAYVGAAFTDKVTVSVLVKDQYGSLCPAEVTMKKLSGTEGIEFGKKSYAAAAGVVSIEVDVNNTTTLSAGEIYKKTSTSELEGAIALCVTAEDAYGNKSNTGSFTLSLKPSYVYANFNAALVATGVTARFELVAGQDTAEDGSKVVDTTVVDGGTLKTAEVTVAAYDADGYAISPATDAVHSSKLTFDANKTQFGYKLYAGAKELAAEDYAIFGTDGNIKSYTTVVKDGTTYIDKLAKGTYTVQLFKYTTTGYGTAKVATAVKYLQAKNFTVVDNQPGLTVKKVKNTYGTIAQAFEVYYGDDFTTNRSGDCTYVTVPGTSYTYVKGVQFNVALTGGEKFVVEKSIGVTLNKEN